MRAANGGRFSDTDYIYYALKESPVGSDLLGALFRFLCPTFEQVEGRSLLISTGAPEKYREYRREGKSPSEAQYWANLTEISGVFEDFGADQANRFADVVVRLWQAALTDKPCDFSQHVYKVEDKPENEVFVTIADLPC